MTDQLKAGDFIRLSTKFGSEDFEIVEFRQCLGIFRSWQAKEASDFTPISELYEPAPDAKSIYIGNYGSSWDKFVPSWMNITELKHND